MILGMLTSSKTEWTWNTPYLKLFDNAKLIIKSDACIKFHDETQPLYLKIYASGVGLKASLLKARNGTSSPRDKAPDNIIHRPIACTSRSLSGAEEMIQ